MLEALRAHVTKSPPCKLSAGVRIWPPPTTSLGLPRAQRFEVGEMMARSLPYGRRPSSEILSSSHGQ